MQESIGAKDLLLAGTLKLGEVQLETYDPPAGQPGNLLRLTLRTDFTANYVEEQDLRQLAEATLNASIPQGYVPREESMTFDVAGAPYPDATGTLHFDLQVSRKVVRTVEAERANAMVRGLPPLAAANVLQANLPLAGRPEIRMSPVWWPWMPLIPFRIDVISAP